MSKIDDALKLLNKAAQAGGTLRVVDEDDEDDRADELVKSSPTASAGSEDDDVELEETIRQLHAEADRLAGSSLSKAQRDDDEDEGEDEDEEEDYGEPDEDEDEDEEEEDEDEGYGGRGGERQPPFVRKSVYNSLPKAMIAAHNRTARVVGRMHDMIIKGQKGSVTLAKGTALAIEGLREEIERLRGEVEELRGQRNAPARPRAAIVTPLAKSVAGVTDRPAAGVAGRELVKAACDLEVAGRLSSGDGVLTEMYVNRGAQTVDDIARANPQLGQRLASALAAQDKK